MTAAVTARQGRLDHAILGVVFMVVTAAFATAWRPDSWAEFSLCMAALLAASGVCLFRLPRFSRSWPAFAFLIPVAVGCLQLAAGATESPAATEARVVRWMACAAVSFLLAGVRGRAHGTSLLDALAAGGAVLALAGAVQAFTSAGHVFWLVKTPMAAVFGPFLNRNHFAAFCELLLPVAIWRSVERPGWRLGAAVMLALAGILSGSRAGVGLLTLEVALLATWAVSPRAGLSRIRSLGWFGGAVAGIPLLAVVLGGEPLLERLRESEPLLYRDQIWAASIDLIRDRPWSGHGLGAFAAVYPSVARFDTGELVHRAHCDWLEWWVEGGALLPLVLAGLLVWGARRTLAVPWLAGVPAVLIHSLVDYPLDRFVLILLLGLLLTVAAGVPTPQKRPQKPLRGV